MPHEHDDDLAPRLEQRHDGESEEFPATEEEYEIADDEEIDDDAIVGK
ncbi:MAG TPA: hypothetical protein VKE51_22600 [Vicinamibacterales bacterium]|nr:hypothetical protein [Vicinamibacterales bacterium]